MPETRTTYPPAGQQDCRPDRSDFQCPPQFGGWLKNQALEELPESFAGQHVKQQADTEKDEMYQQIGPLNVELDFLKKDPGRGS